jgi:RNA polymerase sigma factor (sigma-70 family)
MRRWAGFRPVRRRRPYDAGVGERTPGPSSGASPLDATVAPVASLVERAGAGDQGAWDVLVERFSPLVWSVTRSLGLGGADAADVFQTTWLRLVEHLDRVREPERLGGWLAVTARHEGWRTLRRAGRTIPTEDEQVFDVVLGDEPERGLLDAERDRGVWAAFRLVPARCQALLRLLVADPAVSYQDIGELLDMPIGSIGPTRARCLDKLRTALAETGITVDVDGS